jgi:drug/metabolite transporter (DMT)-like permease
MILTWALVVCVFITLIGFMGMLFLTIKQQHRAQYIRPTQSIRIFALVYMFGSGTAIWLLFMAHLLGATVQF